MIGSSFQYAKFEDVPAYDNAERWVTADGDLEVKLYRHGNLMLHLSETTTDGIDGDAFYASAYREGRNGEQSREDKLNGNSLYEIHERNDGNGNSVFTNWSENTDEFQGADLQHRTMHNVAHLDHDVEQRALLPMNVVYNHRDER